MKNKLQNVVRIIGGKWRGRKIAFPNVEGLRPTPDRIRETVFNWLAPHIVGRSGLDLFAGSGVFGFEALSRGANTIIFVDNSEFVANALRKVSNSLNLDPILIKQVSVPDQARSLLIHAQFDLVFLDPPYQSDLLQTSIDLLEETRCLKPGALIYVEQPRDAAPPIVPNHWVCLKKQESASTRFMLFRLVGD